MSKPVVPTIDAAFVDQHGWLRKLLHRRTGCPDMAADITQDVFVRLLTKKTIPAVREPRAYLARIAHGLLVDRWRRDAIERAWMQTLLITSAAGPTPEEQAEIVEALARIDALLDGLKPRVREVFLLSRLDGLTYPEIARRLSVSLSTVEKDMAQAMRQCYRALFN